MQQRIIAHLDMDAFFASVEEVTTPRFKGKPIVVGAEPGPNGESRGVVSTANYKARIYGIHSAMPISVAFRLSQEAIKRGEEAVLFIPPDFELYNRVSQNTMAIVRKYSDSVEQASIDECYFDLSSAKTFAKAETICKKIKKEIKDKEKVTCSIGIAPNKLVSKIAAGFKKPDGLYVVEDEDVQDFLDPLSIREISGIGPKTAAILYKKNVKIISDLRTFSQEELKSFLGKNGADIYNKIRGIDDNPIEEHREAKSIGEQTTLSANTLDAQVILETMKQLSDSVFKSFLQNESTIFKTLAITVRFADFETKTSAKSFKEGIGCDDKAKFDIEIMKLLLPYLDKRNNPKRKPIRLIGVRVERLSSEAIHYNQKLFK